MGGGGNDTSSEDGSSSAAVVGVSVVGGLLAIGVAAFLVVLCLIIRHKRNTNKYNASVMMPAIALNNQNGYVSLVFYLLYQYVRIYNLGLKQIVILIFEYSVIN